jgi:uncharacterized protein YndB with AHSA1/START domain
MTDSINGISAEAVRRATGKNWDEWIRVLNDAGARDWPHKVIAKWLHDQKLITSGWWCQGVTVGYEYHLGRRIVGETADAGFEIGVQKTFDLDALAVWELITSPTGLKVWLGTDDVKLEKGSRYSTPAGTEGEIRTIDAGKKLRLRWQPMGWDKMTTLQLTLLPRGHKTSINFHQEKLENSRQRQAMKQHWQEVLNRLKELE